MVLERIERGEKWWEILYGFGKLQKARHIYTSYLPEAVRRAQIADPDAAEEQLLGKMTQSEITGFNQAVSVEILNLVLHRAHDLSDGTSKSDYIDSHLPEDVGLEILRRVRDALAASALTNESKKN